MGQRKARAARQDIRDVGVVRRAFLLNFGEKHRSTQGQSAVCMPFRGLPPFLWRGVPWRRRSTWSSHADESQGHREGICARTASRKRRCASYSAALAMGDRTCNRHGSSDYACPFGARLGQRHEANAHGTAGRRGAGFGVSRALWLPGSLVDHVDLLEAAEPAQVLGEVAVAGHAV